jgi:colanic acid biosynthesis glycosyl transferase WcaI
MSDQLEPKRRPRLLVLNQYYGPAESTGQLLREMAEDMASELDVTVVAARPSDEETKAMPHAGVDVRWVPATSFAKGSIALRLLNYLTFAAAALPIGLRAPRPDVLLCMTNPPFAGVLGALLARARRAPLVITFQDVHPDVGLISGRLTSKPAVWGLRRVQRFFLRSADRIVAISRGMRERLLERGAEAERITVIGNWIDAEQITPQPRDNEWAREHELVGAFTVMHSGNVGLLQDLETFVDAAELAPEARFVIVGEGANREALAERARDKGLDNVVFVPRQPRQVLSQLLASADAHLVSLMPGLAGLMEPSKLYGVLAAARPVIAGIGPDSEAAEVVERAECGVLSQPGDPASLAAAVRQLAEQPPAELERMGQRGRAYCERFCTRAGATKAYKELVVSVAAARRDG